jgi:sugar lactone lactonase YvrE
MALDGPSPFPGHDGGAFAPVPSEVVATWAPGHFAENLVVDDDGTVLVSLHSHRRIDRYDPRTGAVDTVVTLPTAATGLARAADGALWVTGGEVGSPPGRIWRVEPDGAVTDWVSIPDAAFLNGCTLLPDGGTLLVCESLSGRVLAVDVREPRWTEWIADDRLRPRSPEVPGANGIKVRDGEAWISVTERAVVYRVPVGAPGELRVAAEHLLADDFAFAADGALYLATHPVHTVVRLDPDGTRTTVAGPVQGAVGSTACAFGPGGALYVTTTGGLGLASPEQPEEAKLLRLDVGPR